MPISVRAQGDVRIIELTGTFTPGHSPSELGQTVGRLLDEGTRKIVLDLGAVRILDSAGLGELIACRKRTMARGGDLRLIRPNTMRRDPLEMLSINQIVQVFDDESAAVKSFDLTPPVAD
jgi:anti-sigma B factor antagonist